MAVETAVQATAGSPAAPLRAGPLAVEAEDGRLRIRWAGVEVVRQIDCPIRDADWRTLAVEETGLDIEERPGGFGWRRRFRTADGVVRGELVVAATADAGRGALTAGLTLTAARATEVNRAGFVVLHPIAGVAGTPLEIRHPDGAGEATAFPLRISPGQPALGIAGLRHAVDGIEVAIDFEGEVFEMEDQRNWTDASFKTHCRPLALPRPYRLEAGETVRQTIRISLRSTGAGPRPPAAAGAATAVMPRITLAHEPALAGALAGVPAPAALARLAVDGLLLRIDAERPELPPLPVTAPVTLEIVTGADPRAGIAAVAAACRAAGLAPRRVIGLPRPYLASHQPDGPWPEGPAPIDLVPLLRAGFPGAEIGGGMLTNFTEFNRCPPDPARIDFASFGTTAIVHAADDRAVIETLEALPQVFESAQALVPGRPLHLGLVSIGMRSNPYGAAVAANPEGRRIAMAMDDPRQREPFAAAFAIGAAAAAARAGVASFAPAMCAGPLGLGTDGALWPIFDAVAALAALGGARVEIAGGPAGPIVIRAQGRGLAANLGPEPVEIDGHAVGPYGFAVFGGGG
jgi:D-apionolactonase